jgi:hypothetical protein
MTPPPYLAAHAAYHADGPPHHGWAEVLDYHLQHGVVVSDARVFLMARPVVMAWPDWEQVSWRLPDAAAGEVADGWHVWSAAGDLRALLKIARAHGAEQVSFQRRNERTHRVRVERMEGRQ